MVDVKAAIKKSTKYNSGNPLSSFKLTSDAMSNQLEPNYYWILDFLQDSNVQVEKVVDNFMASPGSGQFQDFGQRKGIMQQQITKISSDINQVTKSLIQLIYDLREFEIRLSNYKDTRSDNKEKSESALIGLKQIWLDSVDIKKGHGAIHQMTSQGGFTTVRDLFMICNSEEEVKKMAKEGTINEQVMRVLLPRIGEFNKWKTFSEEELTKRFNIERSYLRSQVETLKLYTSWIGPYMKAARELEGKGFDKNPALVGAFSTSMFELTLLGKKKEKGLPEGIDEKLAGFKLKRDYYSVMVISLIFRGHVGQKATQKGDYAYAFGGRLDMIFDSYALNSDELKVLEKELNNQRLGDGLDFFSNEVESSLDELKKDFEHFLNDDKSLKKTGESQKKSNNSEDINPFTALFSGLSRLFKPNVKKKVEKKVETVGDIEKDNFVEGEVRKIAEKNVKTSIYALYDVYKKAHGMASSPEGFDN